MVLSNDSLYVFVSVYISRLYANKVSWQNHLADVALLFCMGYIRVGCHSENFPGSFVEIRSVVYELSI